MHRVEENFKPDLGMKIIEVVFAVRVRIRRHTSVACDALVGQWVRRVADDEETFGQTIDELAKRRKLVCNVVGRVA